MSSQTYCRRDARAGGGQPYSSWDSGNGSCVCPRVLCRHQACGHRWETFPLAILVKTLLPPSFPELWSLGVNEHRGDSSVRPPLQPVRTPAQLLETLPACHLLRTIRDELPPESLLCWSLEGQVTATTAASVSLSNSYLICTLWWGAFLLACIFIMFLSWLVCSGSSWWQGRGLGVGSWLNQPMGVLAWLACPKPSVCALPLALVSHPRSHSPCTGFLLK